jgi:prephenate dehydrogenase
MTPTVLVVGTGLIGSSIGLALQGQRRVHLLDSDAARLDEARRRGAGEPWDGATPVDLVVVCTPPGAMAKAMHGLHRSGVSDTFTHVASVQAHVQADIESLGSLAARVCGGHPLAGRERSGPAAAAADLFLGRPWVICPSTVTAAEVRDAAFSLATDCGASPLELSAAEHDEAVAASSHLVQVSASALAARLLDVPPGAVAVSGPGLADSTRIAASDARLWSEVLTANASFVAPLVAGLARDLDAAAGALRVLASDPADPAAAAVLVDLLERGNRGRAAVPVKRGGAGEDFVTVAVTLADRPGELARVFTVAGQVQVNVEDVRVEHLPGRPTGLVRLLVRPQEGERLLAALAAGGLPAVTELRA